MMTLIEANSLVELKDLLERIMHAPTKSSANQDIKKLEFKSSMLRNAVAPYAYEKLSQAIIYSKQASGQVKDKQHWIDCSFRAWYLFEREINRPVS